MTVTSGLEAAHSDSSGSDLALIVGDRGVGKSSLLQVLTDQAG